MPAAAWGYAAAWVLLAAASVGAHGAGNAAGAQELAVPHQEAKMGLHPRHARAPEEDMLEVKAGTSVTLLEGDTVASKEQHGALGDAVCSQSVPCICAMVLTTGCVCVAQKRLTSGTSSSEKNSAVAEEKRDRR